MILFRRISFFRLLISFLAIEAFPLNARPIITIRDQNGQIIVDQYITSAQEITIYVEDEDDGVAGVDVTTGTASSEASLIYEDRRAYFLLSDKKESPYPSSYTYIVSHLPAGRIFVEAYDQLGEFTAIEFTVKPEGLNAADAARAKQILAKTPYYYSSSDQGFARLKYILFEDPIEGINLKDINKNWSKALVLKKRNQPAELLKWIDCPDCGFSVEGDLNHDQRADKIIVGIYEDVSGTQGRFLLVLTRSKTQNWKKDFLHQVQDPVFSFLYLEEKNIYWATCMGCDTNCDVLIWIRGHYTVESICGDMP